MIEYLFEKDLKKVDLVQIQVLLEDLLNLKEYLLYFHYNQCLLLSLISFLIHLINQMFDSMLLNEDLLTYKLYLDAE